MLFSLLACSLVDRPTVALREAHSALQVGNLEAFEQRVDMETVVPQAAEGCTRVTLLEDWAERSKRPNQELRSLIRSAGTGLLSGLTDAAAPQLVADARAGFGDKTLQELCPAIHQGDVAGIRTETDGDNGTAWLPIRAWGVETELQADLVRGEQGWRVTSLDFDPAIADIKKGLESPRLESAPAR